MRAHGMKISELIKQLETLKEKHGDVEVFAGGEDYPGGVSSVYIKDYKSAYEPKGCACIRVHG